MWSVIRFGPNGYVTTVEVFSCYSKAWTKFKDLLDQHYSVQILPAIKRG